MNDGVCMDIIKSGFFCFNNFLSFITLGHAAALEVLLWVRKYPGLYCYGSNQEPSAPLFTVVTLEQRTFPTCFFSRYCSSP